MSIAIRCEGVEAAMREILAVLDSMGGKARDKAIAQAINQSLAAGRRVAAKEARRAYTAPIKKLFDDIRIERARPSSLDATLDISSGRGVSLIHFQAKPSLPGRGRPKEGVTARARRNGSRHVWKGENGGSKSFIMKKKQGGFGVFVRHKREKNAFEMLFGPSPIQALQRRDTQERVSEAISDAFRPALELAIDKLLAGAR